MDLPTPKVPIIGETETKLESPIKILMNSIIVLKMIEDLGIEEAIKVIAGDSFQLGFVRSIVEKINEHNKSKTVSTDAKDKDKAV